MKKYLLIFSCILIAGIFSSCGRNDFQIQTEIRNAVIYDQPGVSVNVANGVVTLEGVVGDEAAKAEIAALAKETKGVKTVNDKLTIYVAPPTISPDEMLRATVLETLKQAKLDEGIEIAALDDEVTLTGNVSKANEKKIKEAMKVVKAKKFTYNFNAKK